MIAWFCQGHFDKIWQWRSISIQINECEKQRNKNIETFSTLAKREATKAIFSQQIFFFSYGREFRWTNQTSCVYWLALAKQLKIAALPFSGKKQQQRLAIMLRMFDKEKISTRNSLSLSLKSIHEKKRPEKNNRIKKKEFYVVENLFYGKIKTVVRRSCTHNMC